MIKLNDKENKEKSKEEIIKKRSSFEVRINNLQGMLFPIDETLPRATADRDVFLGDLRPIANLISEKVLAAWDDYCCCVPRYSDTTKNKKWKTLTYNVHLSNRLAEIPGFEFRNEVDETNLLDYGEYLIWVKKLNKKSLPIINRTIASQLRINQKTACNDMSPVIVFGFQFASDGTIDNLSFSYVKGETVLWRFSLEELLASTTVPTESPLKIVPDEEEDFIKVRSGAQKLTASETAINQ